MPLTPERVFDPSRQLVVRRFFVGAGRHWRPGDTFDWQRLSIAQRRVAQLFENGKLMHPDEATPPVRMSRSDLAALQAREMVQAPPVSAPEPVEPEVPAPELVEPEVPAPEPVEPEAPAQEATDDLDELGMVELRAIAEREGAPFRVSREAQRTAIRENRRVG